MQSPSVPHEEIALLRNQMAAENELFDSLIVRDRYESAGFMPVSDPFATTPANWLRTALEECRGFSLIRVGDGEMSFICYGQTNGTPILDELCLRSTVMSFTDRFTLSEAWLIRLHEMMMTAIESADALGVLGLWRAIDKTPRKRYEKLSANLPRDLRGIPGHWRGVREMLRLAERGFFSGKKICSAHCYFGLLAALPELVASAQKTICISNRPGAVRKLKTACATSDIDFIPLRSEYLPEDELPTTPLFLDEVKEALPEKMAGNLVLIGAGAWANLLSADIKSRGGVVADIGSAFDLIDGRTSRPVHNSMINSDRIDLTALLKAL